MKMFQNGEDQLYKLQGKVAPVGVDPSGYVNVGCQNCMLLRSLYEAKLKEVEDNINKRIDDRFEEIKELIQRQNASRIQSIPLVSFKTEDTDSLDMNSSIPSFFPICSEESLQQINSHICQKNKDIYCATIQRILRDNLNKNLDKVLSTEVMLHFNLDGTQGKKALKIYDRLLKVLLAVIERMCDTNDEPDTLLRQAITKMKNRHYKRVCMERKTLRRKTQFNATFENNMKAEEVEVEEY